jgi:hypothetical protein
MRLGIKVKATDEADLADEADMNHPHESTKTA